MLNVYNDATYWVPKTYKQFTVHNHFDRLTINLH